MKTNSSDLKAIQILMENGRATWAELGQSMQLTAPAAAERVRKLEEKGVIKGFAALANAEALGYPLLAFVFVTLPDSERRKRFLAAVEQIPEVMECHHVAGDDDFLLKVRCRGTKHLDELLVEQFKEKLQVYRTRSIIVLGTRKESIVVPLDNVPGS